MDEKISFHRSDLLSTKNNHRNLDTPTIIVQNAQYRQYTLELETKEPKSEIIKSSRGLLHDCKTSRNLRQSATFVSSSSTHAVLLFTFHIVFLLVLRGVVNDGGVAGALGVLRVEVELDGDPGVEAGHLEDGDLVGHLPANQR